jgi:hypothetical protein
MVVYFLLSRTDELTALLKKDTFIMKIRFILSVCVVIAAVFLIVAAPVSAQVSNGEDDVIVTSSVSNGDDDTTGATAASSNDLSAVVSNGDDDAAGFTPATGSNDLTGGVSNGGDDEVTTPSTPTDTHSNTSNGGKSSSSKIRSSRSPVVVLLSKIATTSCPVITSELLKFGGANNAADVSRLQSFLKNFEKMDIEVTGTYDENTVAAVKAFQMKYMKDILTPWGATKASGVVYITTIKKINEIGCGSKVELSAHQLSVIDAYDETASDSTQVIGSAVNTSVAAVAATISKMGTSTALSTSTEDDSNVAASANASVVGRFWGFVVDLFR